MSRQTRDGAPLIPPTNLVRAELARSVREARRLRSLLRLAFKAEEDRKFLQTLIPAGSADPGRGVAR
jgi:hypothetical protein